MNSSADKLAGYNSVLNPRAKVGEDIYLEVSYVHGDATVGNRCVLSYIDIHDETIPDDVVLHGLKQTDGKFVCRIYGVEDNPKENRLFGRELQGDLWEEGEPQVLWFARIYPEKPTIREAVAAALELYRTVTGGGEVRRADKSLCSGFNDADPEAILAWNKRMSELVKMNRIAELIAKHVPVSKVQPLDSGSTNTLIDQIFDACDDLLAGKMICGAGGGGFLQVVLKKDVTREELENRLKAVFSDTEIGVWDCELV